MDTCTAGTCSRPIEVKRHRLCKTHNQRRLRHGDPLGGTPLRGERRDGQLWCSRCKRWNAAEEFHRNRGTKTGYDGVCRACVLARRVERRHEIAAVTRVWRQANPELIRAKRRRYRARYGPRLNAKVQQWRRDNPERARLHIRAQNAARYARLKGAPGRASAAQIAARWAYYGDRCWMCRAPATVTDHVKPLARGGSNWAANLRPACHPCNTVKMDRWPWPVTSDEFSCGTSHHVAEANPVDHGMQRPHKCVDGRGEFWQDDCLNGGVPVRGSERS